MRGDEAISEIFRDERRTGIESDSREEKRERKICLWRSNVEDQVERSLDHWTDWRADGLSRHHSFLPTLLTTNFLCVYKQMWAIRKAEERRKGCRDDRWWWSYRRASNERREASSFSYLQFDSRMKFFSTIAVIVCLSIFQLHAAEKCPGPALSESQDDFKWKFDAAPIVAYGTADSVTNNVAKFQIRCLLKGQVPVTELDLPQLSRNDKIAFESDRWPCSMF